MSNSEPKQQRKLNKAWLKRHKNLCAPWLSLSYGLEVVQALAAMSFAWLLSLALVRLFGSSEDIGIDLSLILLISLAAIVRAATFALQPRFGALAAEKVKSAVRTRIHGQVLATGPGIKSRIASGSIASIIVDHIEALNGYYGRYTTKSLAASTIPLIYLIAIYLVNWKLAVVMLAAWLMVPIAMAFIGIAIARASQRQVDELTRLGGHFLDRIQGLTTLRLFGQADAEVKRTELAADSFRRKTMSLLRLAFLSSTALELIASGAIFLTAIYVTSALIGTIGLQQGLFVLILVPEFFLPLRQFTAAYHEQSAAMSAAQKIRELEEIVTSAEGIEKNEVLTSLAPSISVRSLSFSWTDDAAPILDDISFEIATGSLTVIRGPSGAGKSTLLSLLLGFTSEYNGSVKIDGQELSSLSRNSLQRAICWSGQNPYLFQGTLRENLLLAKPDASERDLLSAIENAQLATFIQNLAEGLDSHLNERGSNLSGGQLQRIALARAFLKNAPLLILDEPLTALDPANRKAVIEAIKALRSDRTSLIASHDSELISIADHVIDLPLNLTEANR